jgi:hypothetical protein
MGGLQVEMFASIPVQVEHVVLPVGGYRACMPIEA